jgi:Uma2 family endonuclease
MMLAEVEEITGEFPEEQEMPSFNHSYICNRILRQLFEDPKIDALPELTLNIDKGITPDISVYPSEKIKADFLKDFPKYSEMPILAIEVISASQNIQDLLEKAEMLILNGIKSVWTVEPFTNTIFVTDSKGTKKASLQLIESEGITVDFQKIFN